MKTNAIINTKQILTLGITIGLIILFMKYPFQYSKTYTGKDKTGISTVTEQIDYSEVINFILLVFIAMTGTALTHKLKTPVKKRVFVKTRYPYGTGFTRYPNKYEIKKDEKETVGSS